MPAQSAETEQLSWAESLQATTGICHTCKRAYDIALFLAGITKPDVKYRKTLEMVKRYGAFTVRQKDGEQCATIVLSKVY